MHDVMTLPSGCVCVLYVSQSCNTILLNDTYAHMLSLVARVEAQRYGLRAAGILTFMVMADGVGTDSNLERK